MINMFNQMSPRNEQRMNNVNILPTDQSGRGWRGGNEAAHQLF